MNEIEYKDPKKIYIAFARPAVCNFCLNKGKTVARADKPANQAHGYIPKQGGTDIDICEDCVKSIAKMFEDNEPIPGQVDTPEQDEEDVELIPF